MQFEGCSKADKTSPIMTRSATETSFEEIVNVMNTPMIDLEKSIAKQVVPEISRDLYHIIRNKTVPC
jgi:hypothetical protein